MERNEQKNKDNTTQHISTERILLLCCVVLYEPRLPWACGHIW